MDRSDGLHPFLVLLAGLLGISLLSRPTPTPAPNSTPTVPDASRATVVARAEALKREESEGAAWLRGALPALRLVAEHLGVSEHPAVELLKSPDPNKTLALFQKVETGLGHRPIQDNMESETGLVASSARVARDLGYLARAQEKDKREDWDALAGRAAADAEVAGLLGDAGTRAADLGVEVRFVIATLPDYIDGGSAWDFDQRVEALQRAAADSGFLSDRFYLPDWTPGPTPGGGAEHPRKHETEPGALLFRRPAEPGSKPELLLLLFAPETATLGVHADAAPSRRRLALRAGQTSRRRSRR